MGFCCCCLSNYCFVGYLSNYLNFFPLKHFRWGCRGCSYSQVLLSYMTFKTDKPYPGNAPNSYCFWVILGFQFLSSWGEAPSRSSGAKSHLLTFLTFNHKIGTWAKLKPCSTQRLHWLRGWSLSWVSLLKDPLQQPSLYLIVLKCWKFSILKMS